MYPDSNLERYIEVAEKIAKDVKLDYIRVDTFTSEDGKLFFGELSHSPNAFHNNYSPKLIDDMLYKFYTKEGELAGCGRRDDGFTAIGARA